MVGLRKGARSSGYRKVVAAASIGTCIEIYDLLIYGYLATVLAKQFFPPGDPVAALLATFAIFAIGAFVRPLGSVVFGHVGDRFGRRTALSVSLLLMTVATVGFGILPTYAMVGLLAPVLLVVCRVLQSLSASAEISGAVLLMLEHAPANRRGLTASIHNLSAVVATACAATVSLVLTRNLSPDEMAGWGWRVAFLIAAPIGLVGAYVRLRLLESPDFVALGEQTRTGRAPAVQALATHKRTMVVFAVWFGAQTIGGYTLSVVMPTYLIRVTGMSAPDAYRANLVAVLLSGVFVLAGGFVVDRLPLRPVAITAMAGLAITAVPGLLIIAEYRTVGAAVAGQVLCSIFVAGTQLVGAVAAMTLLPTGVRFTAFAVPVSVGTAIFGSTTPYVSTWLTATTDSPLAPGFYLLAAAVVSTVVTIVGWSRSAPMLAVDRNGDPKTFR
jgi:MHS family proline/betaine transporter-like MFS transporter